MRDVLILNRIIKYFTAEFFAINNIIFLLTHMLVLINIITIDLSCANIRFTTTDRFVNFLLPLSPFLYQSHIRLGEKHFTSRPRETNGSKVDVASQIKLGRLFVRRGIRDRVFLAFNAARTRSSLGIISSLRCCNRSGNADEIFLTIRD